MSSTPNKVRWGILSTGAIAKTFARNLKTSETGTLIAVASRDQSSADRYGDEFQVPHRFARYEDLLAHTEVDAVYVAPPHTLHAVWTIRALEAKKHVLVEKPMGVNEAEVMAMIEAAREHGVLLMEAFMYRCHPQTAKLVELIRTRAIGDVRMIQATFSFQSNFNPDSRLFKNALAGGGILDVGCYPVSMSRLIAGAALGRDFADPIDVKGVAHLGATGVDEWATASLRFENDILAQVATGITVQQENVVRIFGSEGHIRVAEPWVADRVNCQQCKVMVESRGQRREIDIAGDRTSFTYEADVVGRAILAKKQQPESPAMTWDDSLGNARTLDRWRESVGLTYDFEKPTSFPNVTVAGRTLARRSSHNMQFGRIEGIGKPVSRLVMGCDNQRTLPHAAVMFDDFIERGGNAFDTAHIYGHGRQEELFGQWLRSRGVVRDDVVVIAKGAHTPFCDPENLSKQLLASLERMQIDSADIYLMHRDNLQIPVGEFIDVLNEHASAGRFNVFGASNWTIARIEEANDYAKRTGQRGFAVMSNNFSLARMVNPVWSGCIAASDPDSRAWLTKTQMPLLAWSSQARGFFLPSRAAPDKRDDEELVRAWYSDDNFERLRRASELAAGRNANAMNVALAYVLDQQFPTFALVGPRTLSETRTSLSAVDLQLSDEEMKWLNLET